MATEITRIPTGADIVAQFTITDDNGTALNLNTYPGIAVFLYQHEKRKILAQYSLVAATGFDAVTVTNAAAGIFEIYIPRSVTKGMRPNELKAEIKLRKVDGSGEGGMMYTVATDVTVNWFDSAIAATISVP